MKIIKPGVLAAICCAAYVLTADTVSAIAVPPDCDTWADTTRIGDLNGDFVINVLDVVANIDYVFRSGPRPRYIGSEDWNGDGVGNVLDVVAEIDYVFRSGPYNVPHRKLVLTGNLGTDYGPGGWALIGTNLMQYQICGVFDVGQDGATLTCPDKTDTLVIQCGVNVWARPGGTPGLSDCANGVSAFIVRRGGWVHAVGAPNDPIVFTPDEDLIPPGTRDRGDWGGVVINGCAPNNNCPTYLNQAEGDGGLGGGNDPDDSSGRYRYFRVQFAGFEFVVDEELNGITVNSVGRGTCFEYIQVHENADDGIEWFGGTVNINHGVMSGVNDDGYDSDIGAQWNGQCLIVVADPTRGSSSNTNGFEWDNHPSADVLTPIMQPFVANVTLIGKSCDLITAGTARHDGMHLRRAARGLIHHTVATRYFESYEIDDDPPACSAAPAPGCGPAPANVGPWITGVPATDEILFMNCEWYDVDHGAGADVPCDGVFLAAPGAAPYFNEITTNPNCAGGHLPDIFIQPTMGAGAMDFRPVTPGNPAGLDVETPALPPLPAGRVFPEYDMSKDFKGAVEAGDPAPWYDGWTNFDLN